MAARRRRLLTRALPIALLGVTAFGNSIRAAVDAPRLHHQWLPDSTTIEQGTVSEATIAALRARGQAVRLSTSRQGDAHSIWIDPKTGIAYGAADHRSPDSKASALANATAESNAAAGVGAPLSAPALEREY